MTEKLWKTGLKLERWDNLHLWDRLQTITFQAKPGDPHFSVAHYIVENFEQMPSISLHQVARECHVSPATVSRFVQRIGLSGYAELQEFVVEIQDNIDSYRDSHPVEATPFICPVEPHEIYQTMADYARRAADIITPQVFSQIDQMAQEMMETPYVWLISLTTNFPISYHIQNEMMLLYKFVMIGQNPREITTPPDKTCIVLISMYGQLLPGFEKKLKSEYEKKASRIWVVTQSECPVSVPCIRLGQDPASLVNYMAWLMVGDQIVYACKARSRFAGIESRP